MFVKFSQFHSSTALVPQGRRRGGWQGDILCCRLLLQSALYLLLPLDLPFCLSFLDTLHLNISLLAHEVPELRGSTHVLTLPRIGRSW